MIFLRLSSVVMAAFCDKKYVSRRRHVYILRSIFAQPVSYITNRKLFLEKSFSERYLSLSLSSSPVRHWLLFNDAGSKRKFIKLVRLVEFEQYTIFFSFHITYLWASKSGFLYRWLFFADTNRVCKTRLDELVLLVIHSSFPEGEIDPDLLFPSDHLPPAAPPLSLSIATPCHTDISSGVFQAIHKHSARLCTRAHSYRKAGEREISSIVVTRRSYRARVEFYSVVTSFQRRCRSFNPFNHQRCTLTPTTVTSSFQTCKYMHPKHFN